MSLRSEIGESPAAVARLLETAREPLSGIAKEVQRRGIDTVFIAARGTSDHAATYAQYVLGIRNNLAVGLATPSVQSLYGARPRVGGALVIGISQSGQSPDVVEVLASAREQGALTLALTNDPDSPLAATASACVALDAGPELAVAASKTYVAEVAAIALLSELLLGAVGSSALAALPDALARALDREPEVQAVARAHGTLSECAVIGRGYHYPTAREWALKLKEIARVQTDPYSAADFEHGPITLVEPGYQVLALAVRGPTLESLRPLLRRLRAIGATLLVASDDPDTRSESDASFVLDDAVPEWLSPIVGVLPCQLFAYHLAQARGLDPDAPRNIGKVTLTR
jgi:glucosamine--fructose-6-phosphate aminotransferase (isomerizing)